ncbi:hypothetical protein [Zhaonella formicivorans]|uniref:hypothetical protein n=1 Tax=Zhaonella formicivorans TaxID=2528593 RepID=UPI0010E3930D|nr:hypothetical protein [Zhaonella formicivorans]
MQIAAIVIAAVAGLAGALLGSFASYKVVEKLLVEQRNLVKTEQEKRDELAIKIVTKYLWHEIDYNRAMLEDKDQALSAIFQGKEKPKQYSYQTNFKFEEYNKVKYELLKYNSSIIKDIFDLYDIFLTLYKYNDLRELSREEYCKVCNLFTLLERIKRSVTQEEKIF